MGAMDMGITAERDLLKLNQKQPLTQAHGTDMEDTEDTDMEDIMDIEAMDMVDYMVDMAVDIMEDTAEDTTVTASKYHPTSITPPNQQHCRPTVNQYSETFQ